MGFYFNGVSSKEMGIKAHLVSWNTVPTLRGNTGAVPGKSGVIDFGAEYGERYIDIYCNVYPKANFAALTKVLDGVADWLDPTAGVKQLILDDVPGRFFWARLSDTVDTEKLVRYSGAFNLRFMCPDPYAYSTENEIFSLAESESIVRQYGNAVSAPIYTIEGYIPSEAASSITISTNGNELTISGPLNRNQRLVIDSDLLTATVTDEEGYTTGNGLSHLQSLAFPSLLPKTNVIEIATAGKAELTSLTIDARSRWK